MNLSYDFLKQQKYRDLYGMDNNCAWLCIAVLIKNMIQLVKRS